MNCIQNTSWQIETNASSSDHHCWVLLLKVASMSTFWWKSEARTTTWVSFSWTGPRLSTLCVTGWWRRWDRHWTLLKPTQMLALLSSLAATEPSLVMNRICFLFFCWQLVYIIRLNIMMHSRAYFSCCVLFFSRSRHQRDAESNLPRVLWRELPGSLEQSFNGEETRHRSRQWICCRCQIALHLLLLLGVSSGFNYKKQLNFKLVKFSHIRLKYLRTLSYANRCNKKTKTKNLIVSLKELQNKRRVSSNVWTCSLACSTLFSFIYTGILH